MARFGGPGTRDGVSAGSFIIVLMEIVVPEEYRYLYQVSDERPVVKIPDPVLRAKAIAVARVGARQRLLAENMIRIMKQAHGVGLAGPQVGVSERICIVAPNGDRPLVLINPEVLHTEGSVVGLEGCLSIPGLYGDVERPEFAEVRALDRKGRELIYEFEGMAARVALHEIDHLDGVLFIDKVDPATLHWEHPAHEQEH